MVSLEPEPANRAEYDQLRVQLVESGFEPIEGQKGLWEGPVFGCFREMAPGQERMRIKIPDGFPYRHPKVYVEGIVSDHVAASHEVCLWEPNEDSLTWRTLEEIESRSAEWVNAAREGFRPEDEVLDAHLYFEDVRLLALATVELSSLEIGSSDKTDTLWATWDNDERLLTLSRKKTDGAIEGRFYYHDRGLAVPPRTLKAFRVSLTRGQQNNFDRRVENIRGGEQRVVALFWDAKYGGRNALVLLLSPDGNDGVKAEALEVAPTDKEFRLLRAGPDAEELQAKSAVVFGVGAIGSHVAVLLGQCGFGELKLIDDAMLRPADVTRHRGFPFPGQLKVKATRSVASLHSPSANVTTKLESSWGPSELKEAIRRADVVVEATGYGRFSELLAMQAQELEIPFVSAALYRRGAVSRIRRQASADVPLAERTDPVRFPVIPSAPLAERGRLEPGCSEPVNNASPVRVVALAADMTQVIIDTVLGRLDGPEEIIEVHEPLDVAPFDRVGLIGGSE